VLEGDAHQSLEKLNSHAPFDFVFIDADKVSTPAYFEWSIAHVRTGGIISVHNAFREGRILTPETADDHTMVTFLRDLAADTRLHSTIIGVGDGLAMGIKK
jgi:caffeoyl-CoA O-methyltransferase